MKRLTFATVLAFIPMAAACSGDASFGAVGADPESSKDGSAAAGGTHASGGSAAAGGGKTSPEANGGAGASSATDATAGAGGGPGAAGAAGEGNRSGVAGATGEGGRALPGAGGRAGAGSSEGGDGGAARCADGRGVCTAVGSCGAGQGHMSSDDNCAHDSVCCVPLDACSGPEPNCCAGSATLRPACDGGKYVCVSGTFCGGPDAATVDSGKAPVETDSGHASGDRQSLCTRTGGSVASELCCSATEAFPDSCEIGACGCSPSNSRSVSVCNCPSGQCFDSALGCRAR